MKRLLLCGALACALVSPVPVAADDGGSTQPGGKGGVTTPAPASDSLLTWLLKYVGIA